LENYKERNVKDEGEFDQYFERVANQPFKEQMVYETDFFSDEVIQLKSTILGTKFEIHFKTDKELLIAAETILAYFESLLATSLTKVYPSSEFIKIELKKNEDLKSIKFVNNGASYEYIVEFNNFDFANELMGEIMESMMAFAADLISRNFVFENINEHLEKLFKEEEVSERLSLILEHRNFMVSILGNDPKIFFNDWVDKKTAHAFEMKRQTPIEIISDMEEIEVVKSDMPIDLNRLSHNKRKVFSITDLTLWNEAKWQGFGSFTDSLNYSNSSTFGIFLAFENEGVGKQIFENWIKKLGKEDISEEIKITIIKGVDKNNPHWYRVNISRNLDSKSFPSGQIFTLPSRHHEFQPSNSNNLDNLIDGYNFIKQYSLCPAKLIDGNKIVPYYDLAIRKRSLFIKNAWELDEHDLDSVVIKENDEPFIPSGVIGAPVLKVIAKRKSI